MVRLRRTSAARLAVAALGLALASTCLAVAPAAAGAARATSPSLKVTQTVRAPAVTGDRYVVWGLTHYDIVVLSVAVTGAAANSTVELMANQFPFTANPTEIKHQTVSGTTTVTFKAQPSVATRYRAVLVGPGSASAVAKSAILTTYVTLTGPPPSTQACQRPICTEKLTVTFNAPTAKIAKFEANKHLYFYFGKNLSSTGAPPPPKTLALDTSASVISHAATTTSPFQFGWSVQWSFVIGNDGYYWLWNSCIKDTESKDGIGLPGSHGCGDAQISANVAYLG